VKVALLLAVAVLTAPAAAGAGNTPAQLLDRYQPVLYFHPSEDWAPQTVERYLARARIEQSPLRLNLPCVLRSGYACYHRLALADTSWRAPVVYATIGPVPASMPLPPGQTTRPRLLLHYWLFYAVDDWHSLDDRLWQLHEGDWESITVGLDASQTPIFAAYSEHCSGTIAPWSAVTKRGGTHPVAYVALGSHANWFSPSASKTRFAECLRSGAGGLAKAKLAAAIRVAEDEVVDRMGTAHASGPPGLPGVTPMTLIRLRTGTASWMRFAGRWGEGQIVWLGKTPRAVTTIARGTAPGTPNWFAAKVASAWHPAAG
jgi:hypothetical protein